MTVETAAAQKGENSAIQAAPEALSLDKALQEQVTAFRLEISRAMEARQISPEEAQRWTSQGVENILATVKDPEEIKKQIAELQAYLHQHISIHENTASLQQQLESRMDESGVFDAESKKQWLQALENSRQRYQTGEITLAQSQQEIAELVNSLPLFIGSGQQNADDYRKLSEVARGAGVTFVKLQDSDMPEQDRFLQLAFPERQQVLKNLKEKIEKEVENFLKLYPDYAKIAGAKDLFDKTEGSAEKLKVLVDLYKKMRAGEKKRLEEKEKIEILITDKKIGLAQQELAVLKKKLHPHTFAFFGFDKLEIQVEAQKKSRETFLQTSAAKVAEKDYAKAIQALRMAQHIEDTADTAQQIDTLETKQKAWDLYQQAKELRIQEKEEESKVLLETAFGLDPELRNLPPLAPVAVTGKVPKKKVEAAKKELKEWQETDGKMEVVQNENRLVHYIQSEMRGKGLSTSTEESGSAKVRAKKLKPVNSATEATELDKKLKDKTGNMDAQEHSIVYTKEVIHMDVNDADNQLEHIWDLARRVRKKTVRFSQLDFSRNKGSESPMSVDQVVEEHDKKKAKILDFKKKEIAEKHGIQSTDLDAAEAEEKKKAA